MIEILIVTHANMAAGILSSVELITGPKKNFTTIGLKAEDTFETFYNEVHDTLAKLVNDDGVMVFVDLFGGTPCNVTAANINREIDGKKPNVECITGVNLPMVIEAVSMREFMTLNELKEHCMSVVADSVKDVKKEFNLVG